MPSAALLALVAAAALARADTTEDYFAVRDYDGGGQGRRSHRSPFERKEEDYEEIETTQRIEMDKVNKRNKTIHAKDKGVDINININQKSTEEGKNVKSKNKSGGEIQEKNRKQKEAKKAKKDEEKAKKEAEEALNNLNKAAKRVRKLMRKSKVGNFNIIRLDILPHADH